jgi:hypothetical protein
MAIEWQRNQSLGSAMAEPSSAGGNDEAEIPLANGGTVNREFLKPLKNRLDHVRENAGRVAELAEFWARQKPGSPGVGL